MFGNLSNSHTSENAEWESVNAGIGRIAAARTVQSYSPECANMQQQLMHGSFATSVSCKGTWFGRVGLRLSTSIIVQKLVKIGQTVACFQDCDRPPSWTFQNSKSFWLIGLRGLICITMQLFVARSNRCRHRHFFDFQDGSYPPPHPYGTLLVSNWAIGSCST